MQDNSQPTLSMTEEKIVKETRIYPSSFIKKGFSLSSSVPIVEQLVRSFKSGSLKCFRNL